MLALRSVGALCAVRAVPACGQAKLLRSYKQLSLPKKRAVFLKY